MNPWTFPCVYFLLTHKDEELYDEAFRVLAGLRDFTPDVIMTDFERGLRNSLYSAFLSATMDGCLFLFCQATLNWVRNYGIKKAYEERDRDPLTRRCNPSQVQHVSFVSIDDVPSAFISLCDEIPSELCFGDFLAYFPNTCVQGFAAGRTLLPPVFQTTSLNLGTSSSLYRLDTPTQQNGIFWQQCTWSNRQLMKHFF